MIYMFWSKKLFPSQLRHLSKVMEMFQRRTKKILKGCRMILERAVNKLQVIFMPVIISKIQ